MLPTPIVAIVGRPNVGKSSLFNRIMGRRQAIVSDVAGTTRDRLLAEAEWEGRRFILADTGGLEPNPEGPIQQRAQEQAAMVMQDADVIVFVTDVNDGVAPSDEQVADQLRRSRKPVILAVNKVDNDTREFAAEFHRLGIADTVFVSAYHNYGIYELMERVLSYLPEPEPEPELDLAELPEEAEETTDAAPPMYAPPPLSLAIIGRTNVGKSQLVNAILGEERSIVSPVAGTTRDALDTSFKYKGHDLTIIDTAGIRRRGQVERGIENYSVIRAVNAIDRCDIALLVLDATELATAQDTHVAGLAWETGKGVILVINKWDLLDDAGRQARAEAEHIVRRRFHFMTYAPLCFTSALTGQGVEELLQTALNLWQERLYRVPVRKLQHTMREALAEHFPPLAKGARGVRLRVYQVRQVGVNPPTFLFNVNDTKLIHFSYRRYLENRFRETFGYKNTHLKLVFRPQYPGSSPAGAKPGSPRK